MSSKKRTKSPATSTAACATPSTRTVPPTSKFAEPESPTAVTLPAEVILSTPSMSSAPKRPSAEDETMPVAETIPARMLREASTKLETLVHGMIQSDLSVAEYETKIEQANAQGYLL